VIYRHYKGGLYYLVGYATPLYNDYYNKDKTTIEVVAVARNEETLEEVNVSIIYDKLMKSTYYAYDNHKLEGIMCLYRGLDGQYWLRPREKFHEEVEVNGEKVQRFTKVSGEGLFNIISELLRTTKSKIS
jgi:hypothetical protein